MQGRVIRQSGLYLFLLACLEIFGYSQVVLALQCSLKTRREGRKLSGERRLWVVSTVVESKGLRNTSGRCLGFFISICNSLC